MKIFTLCLFLAFSYLTIGQTKVKKIKAYKVIVITEDKRIEGFLHSADTSQLNVLEDVKKREAKLISVKNTDIMSIEIGRKGRLAKGIIIGAVIGGTIGFFTGKSNNDVPLVSSDTEGAISAISLGIIGGGLGALIGSGKKKIDVDFSATKYLNGLNVIRHYSMVKIKLY